MDINRMIGRLSGKSKGESEIKEEEAPLKDIESSVVSIAKGKNQFFRKIRSGFESAYRKSKPNLKYTLLVIPIIATYFIVQQVQRSQTLKIGAATHSASVSFNLQSRNLPPAATFGVWISSDTPVAFARVDISYDASLVKLTQDPQLVGPLTRVIKMTPMGEANTTGKISLILALDPANKNAPPTGPFQIANLVFDSNTTTSNVNTSLNFDTGTIQLVATDQIAFTVTAAGSNLTLNYVATPSPTPTLSPSQTPVITSSPKPSQTPSCSFCRGKKCNNTCDRNESTLLCSDCITP